MVRKNLAQGRDDMKVSPFLVQMHQRRSQEAAKAPMQISSFAPVGYKDTHLSMLEISVQADNATPNDCAGFPFSS